MGAREDVAVKQEQVDVAKAKADRATDLLANKAISEKAHEDAHVELTRAKAALSAAAARLDLLNGTDVERAAGSLSTLVLESPVDGVLNRLFVAPGQTVPAGAGLFDVAGLSRVWVRVPVYVGDLEKVDVQKGAAVMPLGGNPKVFQASPTDGPPLSDPSSASSDLYFELPNGGRIFRIGQKVGVSLVKKGVQNSLAVPWSAILYDFYGGTWVYVKTAAHTYSRNRVELSHVIAGTAILTRGVNEGDTVVVSGAAEIFGTEFGVGK
jgi:RND family efflux transporter MFP subunit